MYFGAFAEGFTEKGIEATVDRASGFRQKWKMKTGGTSEIAADEDNIKDIGGTIERNIVKLNDAQTAEAVLKACLASKG